MGSRGRTGLAFVISAAVLTGCAGIPTSGSVVEGDPVLEPQPQYAGFEPDPPVPGADEVGIVAGFVDAMASYERDYQTAREFLAADATASWNPADNTTIYDSAPTIVQTARGAVRVTITVVATVGPDGYVKAPPGPPKDLDLTLEQVDGEWRISNPPSGIIVSDLDFANEFEPYNLYFFDPAFEKLVPDPVFLPVRGSRATLLAEALLRGPSRWLAPAVATAFPPETGLGVPVRVDSGRATVELTSQARTGTPEQVRLMGVQLAWALSQLDGIQQVSVTSDGRPLMAGEATSMPVDSYPEYSPNVVPRRSDLYAAAESGLVVIGDSGPVPVPGPLGSTSGIREIAVNVDVNRAATVDSTGESLIWAPFESEAVPTVLATGTNLVSLSWDRTNLIWAVDQAPGGSRLIVCEPGREPATVAAAGLDGRRVDDVAVSLDGTRVAFASEGDVLLGIVLRDPKRPENVQIDALHPLALDGRRVTDVSWAGPTTLAVLVQAEGAVPEPYRVELAQSLAKPAGSVPGADTLTASPGQGLVVSTVDGTMLRQAANLEWTEIGDATAPAYPG